MTFQEHPHKKGTLYMVATPIGNLEDITYRAVRILEEVDLIVAEDTRNTRKLLTHYQLHTKLLSYHEHNKKTQGKKIIEELKKGKNIACVSDAGLPIIADPGLELVQDAIRDKIPLTVIPGANAALTALLLSGLNTEAFTFLGFLPRKKKKVDDMLLKLAKRRETLIIYEAPHHLLDTLKTLQKHLGKRHIALAKELTKYHEEVLRGTFSDIIEKLEAATTIKGEYVIIVEGSQEESKIAPKSDAEIVALVEKALQKGIDKKTAIKDIAETLKIPKRKVYQLTLKH